METVSDNRHAEIVELLREAVDFLAEAVASGRLGFDYAVKEYVEQSDNELSRAFQEYVQALQMGDETARIGSEDEDKRAEEIRRTTLRKLAAHLAVPEVIGFVDAVLESQDKRLSIAETLENKLCNFISRVSQRDFARIRCKEELVSPRPGLPTNDVTLLHHRRRKEGRPSGKISPDAASRPAGEGETCFQVVFPRR